MRCFRIAAALALAVCSAGAGSRPPTAAILPTCTIEGAAGADERAGLLRECRRALSRFAELFGEPLPAVAIVLADGPAIDFRLEPAGLIMAVPSRRYSRALADSIGRTAAGYVDDLPVAHELAHAMTIWWLGKAPAAQPRYGSQLPDWFDEAVAIWAESDASRARRLEAARLLPDSLFDLSRLAATRHPNLAAPDDSVVSTTVVRQGFCVPPGCLPAGRALRTRVFRGGTVLADTVPEEAAASTLPSDWFYGLAYSLLEFLHGRGGADAVTQLLRRFAGGWPDRDVFAGLAGFGDDARTIQADWLRWVRARPSG